MLGQDTDESENTAPVERDTSKKQEEDSLQFLRQLIKKKIKKQVL
jgi:hypothetical protein